MKIWDSVYIYTGKTWCIHFTFLSATFLGAEVGHRSHSRSISPPHQNLTACILKLSRRVVLQGVKLFDLKKAKTYYCCWLITYLEQLVILKSSVWSVCYIKIILFLQDSSKKGDRYTTDYRSTGGRGPPPPPRRRFGGFGGGGGGPAAPPCGTGGGWG